MPVGKETRSSDLPLKAAAFVTEEADLSSTRKKEKKMKLKKDIFFTCKTEVDLSCKRKPSSGNREVRPAWLPAFL